VSEGGREGGRDREREEGGGNRGFRGVGLSVVFQGTAVTSVM